MSEATELLDRFARYLGAETDEPISAALGVSRSAISSWRNRDSVPYRHFIEFAKRDGMSLDWLFLGKGPTQQPQSDQGSTSALEARPLRALLLEEERAAEEALGIGEVATLARLGTTTGASGVLEALLAAPPQGLTLDQLATALVKAPREISPHIALLRALGSIEESEDGRLRWCSPREVVLAQSLPDKHQVALTAAQLILRRILPAQKRGQGGVELVHARVGRGQADSLAKALFSDLSMISERALDEAEESETLTVVLAVAAEPD